MNNITELAYSLEAAEEIIGLEAGTTDQAEGEEIEPLPSDLPHNGIVPITLTTGSEWTSADLNMWLDNEPPEMDFLFQDIFPAGIAAALCGSGGLGKSTFALELAYSAATGMTVFPAFIPVKPRKVMILLGEDPKVVTWKRVRSIAKRFPMTPEQQTLLVQNLAVYPLSAKRLCSSENGKVCPTPAYQELAREVSRIRPALLIIDPKSRWAGTNENSNDEATAFVEVLEALVRPHGAGILLTHHVSKGGKKSPDASGVRGASALVDGLRLVFTMVREGDGKNGDAGQNRILLTTSKSNFTRLLAKPIVLDHSDEYDGILEQVVDGNGRMRLINIAQVLADWLAANGPMNMSAIKDPRDDRARALCRLLQEKCGSVRKDLEDAVQAGIEEGLLVVKEANTGGRSAQQVSAAVVMEAAA